MAHLLTPGDVLRVVFCEARDRRGPLPDFIITTDANGVEWDDTEGLSFDLGTPIFLTRKAHR